MPHFARTFLRTLIVPAVILVSGVAGWSSHGASASDVVGAANHLTQRDGRVIANNTDGSGFLRGLKHERGIEVASRRVGVFGGGGAARAIVFACADAGADVRVVTRNPAQTDRAIAMNAGSVHAATVADLARCDIVVNATPIGMAESAHEDEVPFDVARLADDAVVVDIVYNPLETPLIAAARARDLAVVDGLAMLVGQAAEQFEAWTDEPAPLDVMRAAARA